MKIKIFAGSNYLALEENVNNFIKDKNVLDIKYQSFCYYSSFNTRVGYPVDNTINERVLIIYEEKDPDELEVVY